MTTSLTNHRIILSAAIAFVLAAAVSYPVTAVAQQDMSLSKAIDIALEKNYDIRIIEKDVEVAETNNSWGAAGRLPTIDFSVSASGSQDFNDDNPDVTSGSLTPGVTLAWTLFDGHAISIRKDRFETLERISRGNAAVVIEQTIQDVLLAYYTALLEQEKLGVLEEVMNLSYDRYQYVSTQKELGSAVTYDLLQAKNAWLEDKANHMLQIVTHRNAIRDLNYLMGVPEETDYRLTGELTPPINDYSFDTLLDRMFSDNTTLKNQFLYQSLLEKEINLAKSDYYPTLSLRTGVDATGSRRKVEGTDATTTRSAGAFTTLTLNFSLFDGGARKRAVKIARIDEEAGQIEIEEMKHSLSNQLAKLVNLYDVRKDLVSVADENLEAAQLNMQISGDKFRAGTINSFNYRDVQLIYLNASISRLNAVYNLIDSNTALMRIIGGIIGGAVAP